MRYRPNTDGCTELSCKYHGTENERKQEVHALCTIDSEGNEMHLCKDTTND